MGSLYLPRYASGLCSSLMGSLDKPQGCVASTGRGPLKCNERDIWGLYIYLDMPLGCVLMAHLASTGQGLLKCNDPIYILQVLTASGMPAK